MAKCRRIAIIEYRPNMTESVNPYVNCLHNLDKLPYSFNSTENGEKIDFT